MTRAARGGTPGRVRPRVLVIDDDHLVGRSIGRVLARVNDVVVHEDPVRALATLLSGDQRFDAIVCDLMMPAMTGVELLAALRAISDDLPGRTLLLTAGAITRASQEFVRTTDRPILTKPFAAEELLRAVHALTSAPRSGG